MVTLTDEGRSFLADAKRLLALAAETVESVRRLHSGEVRALNVGYVSNLFYDLLPKTLASFHQSFPAVSVNLFDLSCGDQFRALEDGKLDLGFVGLHEPIARRGLEFRTIASYKTVAALPKDNPLAGKTTVELKALAPMFFIGMSEASYPGYREWLTKTCERAGFTPKVLQDVELERTMIHAVAAGLGVALVPEQLKKLEHENVVFRPLNPTVGTEGCVAWRTENPVGCPESVRADRRANGPEHPLIGGVAVTVLTYFASMPVRMISRFIVDFCEAGEPDDVSLQNEIAFCNRRTQLQWYPNLFYLVG